MIPETFHFLRPLWLLALAGLLPIVWTFVRRTRASGAWERICDAHLLRHLVAEPGSRTARWPLALLAAGWLSACLALAGPTFERLPQTSFREPSRTVLVLGLAPSMNQRDVRPSRLARARHKLIDALDRVGGGSVALVVYKEEAFAVTPLTDDTGVLREAIPLLETRLMPGRSVKVARGIEEARRLLEPAGLRGARIVLVSDGADDDPGQTRAAVQRAAAEGAQISVLAVTEAARTLGSVAEQAGGAYAALAIDDADLEQIFAHAAGADALGATLAKSEAITDEWNDLGAWLVWVPLVLAPFAFRRGWAGAALVLLCVQLGSLPSQADVLDVFRRPDQRGARAFDAGHYAESAQQFQDPAWQAAARYRAGDFAGAAQTLSAQPDAASQYNLGNALAKDGKLQDALAAFERALAAQPEDADARFNRDLVKQLLEEQKQPEQSPQTGQQDQESQSGDSKQDEQAQQGSGGESDENSESQLESGSGDPGSEQADAKPAQDSAQQGAQDAQPEDAAQQSADARSAERDDAGQAQSGETAAQDPGELTDETPPQAGSATGGRAISAAEQQRDQALARLPDDPGGLLREKIRRDYLRKQAARRGEDQ